MNILTFLSAYHADGLGDRRDMSYRGRGYRRREYGRGFTRSISKERGAEIYKQVKKMMDENISMFFLGSAMDWLKKTYENEQELKYAVGCAGGALKDLLREKMGFVRKEPQPAESNPQ